MQFVMNRSLLGATAMVIVGIVLSMMSRYYFAGGSDTEALTTSRWWWEIVLNSQILCAAFIWFTHIELVKSASGWRLAVSLLQMLASLTAVLLPVWIAIVAILLGWFETRPSLEVINQAFCICLGLWGASRLLMWGIQSIGRKRLILPKHITDGKWHWLLLGLLPLFAAIALSVFEMSRGGIYHYIYAPFLFYVQGAVPYLENSFRLTKGRE